MPRSPKDMVRLARTTPPVHHGRRPKTEASVNTSGMSSTASQELGAAVAMALFGQQSKLQHRRLQSAPVTSDQGESMEPIIGSVLSVAPVPPGWMVKLLDEDGTPTKEPVVAWATVVIFAAYDSGNEDPDTKGTKQFQTEVQPLSLTSDGVLEVPALRDDCVSWSLIMLPQIPG